MREAESRPIIVEGGAYTASNDPQAAVVPVLEDEENVLSTGDTGFVEWKFTVREAGLYRIDIRYRPLEGKGNAIERKLAVNGDELDQIFSFPRMYVNRDTEPLLDADGNQLRPVQSEQPRFADITLSGSDYNTNKALEVLLREGTNVVRLTAVREPMAVAALYFYQAEPLPSYDDVSAAYTAPSAAGAIHLEGEAAALKSAKTLYPVSDRSSALNSPPSTDTVVMNMIGGANWGQPGQYLEWNFHVKERGLYKIVLRVKQDFTPGQISNRRLRIDGEIPFAEAEYLEFPYGLGFANVTLGSGDTVFLFKLEAGDHTLRLENNVGAVGPVLESIDGVVDLLNGLYRQVFMITGSYPDADRDYHIALQLPQIETELRRVYDDLQAAKAAYLDIAGEKGSGYAEMDRLCVQLESFLKDVETIPVRLDTFRTNISNLSSWLLSAVNQPLLIDTIDLLPQTVEPGKAKEDFFSNLLYQAKLFFLSFVLDYNSISAAGGVEETITLWLGTGRDQAQALKAVVESAFTPETHVGVNIRLVDINVLLPAVAANHGPDIAISLERSLPMNYAYRGAVQDLSDFTGFQDVLKRFPTEALTEFRYGDSYYALPDKFSFLMMFYRRDILEDMGAAVPETWDDVYALLPQLQNRNMTIGLPNLNESGNVNNIDLFTTLLYQEGGAVYNEGLTASLLDSEEALTAFKRFTDFYTKYKVNQKINHLTYFRTGETPIVFMPYTFFANLEAAAPEIKGQWGFAQMPGTEKDDGSVSKAVAGTSTGCSIFSNSRHKEAAWSFLEWWTRAETQSAFGMEIENIQGSAGRYASANLEALNSLPWAAADLQEIMEEAEQAKAMPEAPGGYLTGRYIVTSALTVINNGLLPRETLLDYNKLINDEVQSMRRKFGL